MRQSWADYRVFWQEFRRTFTSTGAIAPSGRALSAALARYVGPHDSLASASHPNGAPATASAAAAADTAASPGRRILEVGPGTGAVTAAIVRRLQPSDRLVLVERNETFVARLQQRIAHDPAFHDVADRIALVHASVEELPEDQPFDVIVSGLPLNNFPVDLVERILTKLTRLLAPGGTLSFFEYVAIRRAKALVSRRDERERLQGIGAVVERLLREAEVDRRCVWINVPPAWVHHLRWK